MSGFAVARGRYDPRVARRVSGWERYGRRKAALADARWPVGAYDVRFMRTGSDEVRKALNAVVGLTVGVALFSYAISLELLLGCVLVGLLSATVLDLVARSTIRKRFALPDEAAKSGDHARRRLLVKPGLTGLWLTSGQSDLSWEKSVWLDLRCRWHSRPHQESDTARLIA
jgi:hypothetical protein